MNPLSFYELKIVPVSEGVGAWQVNCHRCGLVAQCSQAGPYKIAPDLTMLINTHVCDPARRAKQKEFSDLVCDIFNGKNRTLRLE